jgi:outer membrane murein-binding lipoprotein Lpp
MDKPQSPLSAAIAALRVSVEEFAALKMAAHIDGNQHAAVLAEVGQRITSEAKSAAQTLLLKGEFDDAAVMLDRSEDEVKTLNAAFDALVGNRQEFSARAYEKMKRLRDGLGSGERSDAK